MFKVNSPMRGACAALAVTVGLAGCTSGGGYAGPTAGTGAVAGVVGGVAGGVLGSQFGKGSGKTAATIAGAIIGAGLSAGIANYLSEQGKAAASQTTQQTLSSAPTGSSQRWDDPQTGVYGTVRPTSEPYYVPTSTASTYPQTTYPATTYPATTYPATTYPSTTSAPVYQDTGTVYGASTGRECRDYETTVYSQGRPETLVGTMCRNSPGEPWRPVI